MFEKTHRLAVAISEEDYDRILEVIALKMKETGTAYTVSSYVREVVASASRADLARRQ